MSQGPSTYVSRPGKETEAINAINVEVERTADPENSYLFIQFHHSYIISDVTEGKIAC